MPWRIADSWRIRFHSLTSTMFSFLKIAANCCRLAVKGENAAVSADTGNLFGDQGARRRGGLDLNIEDTFDSGCRYPQAIAEVRLARRSGPA